MKLTQPNAPPSGASGSHLAGRLLGGLILTLLMLVPLSLALVGAWVGTTLAVYNDGPIWVAAVGAVVAFFVLPLLWELWADREQRGGRIRDAILRSSFLSAVLVVGLVGTHPEDTFKALATRGDWFLAGARGPAADTARGVLFTLADGMEWLNDWARTKAFRDNDQGGTVDPGGDSAWPERQQVSPPRTATMPGLPIPGSDLTWPLPAEISPVVRDMPDEAKKSIKAVGAYVAAHVEDPFQRVKAVHDFVATWVDYDYAGLRSGAYKRHGRQAARTVFHRHRGVCAGYSNLMVAVGRAARVRIIYLGGDSRSRGDYAALAADEQPAAGAGHAWNAAKIGDRWYLLDATWDSDSPREDGSAGEYETTYLFIPPKAILLDHRPDAKRWQLVEQPLSRGEWLREPLVKPIAFAYGLTVKDPRRPIASADDGVLQVLVDNPYGDYLSVAFGAPGAERTKPCGESSATDAVLRCAVPSGRHVVVLYAGLRKTGWHKAIGGVLVDSE